MIKKPLVFLVEIMQSAQIANPLERLSKQDLDRKTNISKVMTETLRYLSGEITSEGFDWLLPVVFSKTTDPLWPDPGASIEKRVEVEIYEQTVRTTASMIIHKLVSCSLAYPKLFVLSPNVRIEKRERQLTGWHNYEFTQLDFEVRNASSKQIRKMVEGWMVGLIKDLRRNSKKELSKLRAFSELKVPKTPFKVYDADNLKAKYGESEWEKGLLSEIKEPAWVVNIPREFYDYQDFETKKWDNYDLFVPKYGEILSGSKREFEHDKILTKIQRDGVNPENFALVLNLAKEKKLKPTAGGGIGLERLVCWLTKGRYVGEASPFPRVPGIVYDL
ncbi:MAG: asparagine synthetase A [Thaumarchaeota archaeon]|nr:asparagine synthetase A [Nitrososphaerota archaeon]